MEDVLRINYGLLWLFAALTLFGLYRPWLALWWLPVSNRKMVLQRYGLITLGLLISYAVASALHQDEPSPISAANERHLFYLHGRIVEEQGAEAVSERFGPYAYQEILKVFADSGFVVRSEVRAQNTDVHQYADRITGQIEELLDAGVVPQRITVVGASKGAVIAMLTSTKLQNPAVNFVLIAGCNAWAEENLAVNLCGRILSIFERSDELGRSCETIFSASSCEPVTREIELNTRKEHGILYQPLPEWVEPTVRWAK
ncbi:MAG: alpha/beta hydrolase [Tunicatimonas sp.]